MEMLRSSCDSRPHAACFLRFCLANKSSCTFLEVYKVSGNRLLLSLLLYHLANVDSVITIMGISSNLMQHLTCLSFVGRLMMMMMMMRGEESNLGS